MMPTSATGARRSTEAGFTLVELMVTLFIIGLVGGAIMLTVPDGRRSLSEEAERFSARLRRAQEEAVLTNRPIDVAVTADGYRFRAFTRGAWTPLEDNPFGPQAWGEGLSARLQAADGRTGVRFDPLGGADSAVITLRRGARALRVVVDEAGNVRIDATAG